MSSVNPSPPPDERSTPSAVPRPRPAPIRLDRGACVDRYIIVEQIGAGGMGVVYRAFDPELGRPIALKLMHSSGGSMMNTVRDRLLREAQALARLSHPNVIAVYDVGTFEDNVFVAMEFVEGPTLRRWLRDTPRTTAEVLATFMAAGEGLQAAHRADLVHRDFKPDNVIVGSDGRVRVLDFGLARAARGEQSSELTPALSSSSLAGRAGDDTAAEGSTIRPRAPGPDEDTRASGERPPSQSGRFPSDLATSRDRLQSSLTRAGAVMGTPRFMAPEQHSGLIADERADQYSFCVSLYYALYGQFAHAGETEEEYANSVVRGLVREPPATARVPRWMFSVLQRGLAADPAARYPSMAALLLALRADPRIARAKKLRFVGALAVAAVAVGGWQLQRSQQLRACAGADRKLAGIWDPPQRRAIRAAFHASGKPYAEIALATVERAFDDYAAQWVAMRGDACAATHVRGDQSQDLLDLRMMCLDERLTQMKTMSELFATADGKLIERAAQSAQSLPGLAQCADAVALRAPLAPPSDPATRKRVEEVRQQLARAAALDLTARYDEGLRLARGALAGAQALHYPPVEAEAQLRLALLQGSHGDYKDAPLTLQHAYVAALAGHHEENAAQVAVELIEAIGERQAHYEEADRWAEVAEALVNRLQRKDELLGVFYTRRSRLRWREARYDEAYADVMRALEIKKRIFGPDHYNVAEGYQALGNIYYYQAKYREAAEAAEHSLQIQQRTLGSEHPRLTGNYIGIANAYGELGDHEKALATYNRALAILKASETDHPNLATIQNNMGSELETLGRHKESLVYFERALELWQKRLGPSQETIIALGNIGGAKLALGRLDEALVDLRTSLAQCEKILSPNHTYYGDILARLGEVLRRQGKLDEAMSTYRHAIAVDEKALGPKHPQLVMPLIGIAQIELTHKALQSAKALVERALLIIETEPGDGGPLADVRFVYARVLWAAGEHPPALAQATQARDGYVKAGTHTAPSVAEVSTWLTQHRR